MKLKKLSFTIYFICLTIFIVPITPSFAEYVYDNSYVYYINMHDVKVIAGDPTLEGASELPRTTFIIPPGTYFFEGKSYTLVDQGLYRFVAPLFYNQQRIVYTDNLDAFLSAICWVTYHGNLDDHLYYTELDDKVREFKLSLTCGSLTWWANHLLEVRGIQSRIVHIRTLESTNLYNDGHMMLEVYRNDYNKWVLYDLSMKVYFVKDNVPLSLIEFAGYTSAGEYSIVHIADSKSDINNFHDSYTGYNYGFIFEHLFANDDTIKAMFKRLIGVPMIFSDVGGPKYYFFDLANRDLIESFSPYYTYLDQDEFKAMFYQ